LNITVFLIHFLDINSMKSFLLTLHFKRIVLCTFQQANMSTAPLLLHKIMILFCKSARVGSAPVLESCIFYLQGILLFPVHQSCRYFLIKERSFIRLYELRRVISEIRPEKVISQALKRKTGAELLG
jgi:hypothetical protein